MGLFDIFKKEQKDAFDNTAIQQNAVNERGSRVGNTYTGYSIIDDVINSNRIKYAHIIAAIKRGNYEVTYCAEDGFAIWDKSTDCLMPESLGENAVLNITSNCSGPQLRKVETTSQDIYEYLSHKIKYNHYQVCVQGVCEKSIKTQRSNVIRPATADDLGYIKSTYYDMDINALLERIQSGNLWMMYEPRIGYVVGYCGIHDDDTIGFTFVSPDRRRQGLGLEITDYVTDILASRGFVPYVQILSHNIAEIKLYHKLGYEYNSDGFLYWMFDEYA